MSEFVSLHLLPAVGEALASLGWSPAQEHVRRAAATAARGNDLVMADPPSPAYAAPAIAGLVSRLLEEPETRALMLTPAPSLSTWGSLAGTLCRGTTLRPLVTEAPARAGRRESLPRFLVTTPDTVAELHRRSALDPATLATIVIAWPETWDAESVLPPLMQDISRDAQRLLFTSDLASVTPLIERYAWRAPIVGSLGGDTGQEPPPAAGPVSRGKPPSVRVVSTPWHTRATALGDVVDLLDPARVTVWARDRSEAGAIERALELSGVDGALAIGDGPVPSTDLLIGFDIPSEDRLAEWSGSSVVLLAPTGTERYLARVAPARRPLLLPGSLDRARDVAALRRGEIVRTLDEDLGEDLLAVAPLLERYEAPTVAAALHHLWRRQGSDTRVAPAAPAAGPATGTLWIGAGRKDGATAADFVALFTKELAVDRAVIGKIDIYETFALLELPAAEIDRLGEAVTGRTIRRRRLIARPDRGRGKRAETR